MVFACAPWLAAQATASSPSDSAPALATGALRTMAGGAAVTDLTLSGQVTRYLGGSPASGPITLAATASGQSRVEYTVGAGHAADPAHWALSYAADPREAFGASSAGVALRQQPLHLERLPLAGQSQAQNAVIARLSGAELYLDSQTSLPTELDFNLHPDQDYGRNVPVRIVYSDYRRVEGVELPFHIQQYLEHALFLDIQVESAQLNTGLQLAPLADALPIRLPTAGGER